MFGGRRKNVGMFWREGERENTNTHTQKLRWNLKIGEYCRSFSFLDPGVYFHVYFRFLRHEFFFGGKNPNKINQNTWRGGTHPNKVIIE